MIIRQSIARQGQRITTLPVKSWNRSLATAIDTIETSLDDHLQETKTIQTLLQTPLVRRIEIDVPSNPGTDKPELSLENRRVRDQYYTLRHHRKTTGSYGSDISRHYRPSDLLTNPPRPSDITLELLLASQSHLGHSTSLWNPMNSRYIFGIRQGIHIFSLDVTASHLRRACRIVSGVAERGGLILFAGTRPGQDRCVVKAAELAGGCHLFERWTPGSITNGHQILSRCKTKVVDEFDREMDGYAKELVERPALKPDLVVCLNPLENWVLLHECGMNAIPTIGIIDTDANPTWVTYPIPANDDSLRCVQVIAGVLGRAGEEGRMSRLEKAKQGELTYQPDALMGDEAMNKKSADPSEMEAEA